MALFAYRCGQSGLLRLWTDASGKDKQIWAVGSETIGGFQGYDVQATDSTCFSGI